MQELSARPPAQREVKHRGHYPSDGVSIASRPGRRLNRRDLVRYAKMRGWRFLRHGKGSHDVYVNPSFKHPLVIPTHGSKDIAPGTLKKLLRQIDGVRSN